MHLVHSGVREFLYSSTLNLPLEGSTNTCHTVLLGFCCGKYRKSLDSTLEHLFFGKNGTGRMKDLVTLFFTLYSPVVTLVLPICRGGSIALWIA